MEKHEICKQIIRCIKDYISTPECLEAHRTKNHFVRKRKLSMSHLITYLFYTNKASMYQNIASIREDLSPDSFPVVSKQAVSKARQYIDPSLFQSLYSLSVDIFYRNIPKRKLWNGFHIYAIDGSKFEIPNDPTTFEFFGEMFTFPNNNRKFTSGLASMIYDVLDDYIIHGSLHRYLAPEREAAKEHMKTIETLDIYKNSIVIFDRGYYSEDMFRYCVEHNHLCLIRLKDKLKISRSCKGDTISILPGNSKTGTEDISIRVIEVTLDSGTKEYLATNIFDKNITVHMFKELYFLRRPIDSKYFELKERFRIEEYSGKTAVAIFQEYYINLLLSNLTSLIKSKVDDDINEDMIHKTKNRYQANRTYILGRLKKMLPKILCDLTDTSIIDEIVKESYKVRSQLLPGRSFKRKTRKLVCRKHFSNRKVAF